jgi:hypothetical protein
MTITTQEEYDEILERKQRWEDEGCTCFINPPCSYCVEMPSEEELNALKEWDNRIAP